MLRENVSLGVRLLHYITAVVLIAAFISIIPFTYTFIRFVTAGTADTYNAVELYTGGYVGLDYDYIREFDLSCDDKTYCIAKFAGKDEYCIILYPGVNVMSGEYATKTNYHDNMEYKMEMENVSLNSSVQGTIYGIVELNDSTMYGRFREEFEKLNSSYLHTNIVEDETIDISRAVSFESPRYIYGNFFSRLILIVICIPLFIIGCRLFSTQKRQAEERELIKDDLERRKSELLDKAFDKRRGRID